MTRELRRILLVEDDPDIAILATMALQDLAGFEVVHAASGPRGLELARTLHPDMLILDFSMPGMDGDEVLTTLRSDPETKDIPAVFMTASVMPAHVNRLKELGAIDVFAKPFDPITLGERVREAWLKAHEAR